MAGRIENPVILAGFTELERDLKATSPALLKAMRIGLTIAVQPIKREADRLALTRISGMARARKGAAKKKSFIGPVLPAWSVQKTGQNTKEVYMVPTEKGARARNDSALRRPNFATLMLGKSYDPALEGNRVQVLNTVDHVIGTVTRTF
jgi:hypothetical protein